MGEAVYICKWCEKEFSFDHAMKNKNEYWRFFYCSPKCYVNDICDKWTERRSCGPVFPKEEE